MIIVWILTFVTLALTIFLGAPLGEVKPNWVCKSPADWGMGVECSIRAWGQGFWALLGPSMQLCIMLITGYVVARAPLMKRMLGWLASIPKKPAQAVLMLSIFSMITACVHWGLSLMASGMLAVFIVRNAPELKVDYRLLIASAYLGLGCTWHAGLTGTAPLWANTPGNPTQNILKQAVPQTQTIFTLFNVVLLLIVIVSIATLIYLLHPSQQGTLSISKEQLKTLETFDIPKERNDTSFSNRLLWWPGFSIGVVLLGLAWLCTLWRISKQATELFTFDNINFVFLILGIALNYRPILFLNAVEEAGRAVWGIIIQFPFYAGIYGLFTFTNLGVAIAQRFVSISTPKSFPLITFWYTGVLNYFIPSGGAEWLVTSPYLVPTVETLHVPMSQLILAFAWGNMMTDMIQPFYAIPLLAVAKLKFRDIMGYLLVVFLLNFVITTTAFFIMPRL